MTPAVAARHRVGRAADRVQQVVATMRRKDDDKCCIMKGFAET
jgi:hypothetical protein